MREQTVDKLNLILAQDALASSDVIEIESKMREIRELCQTVDLDYDLDPQYVAVQTHLTAIKHGWKTGNIKLVNAPTRPGSYPIMNLASEDFFNQSHRKHFANLVNLHLRETLKITPTSASMRQLDKPGCVAIGYYFETFSIAVVSHGSGHGMVTITTRHCDTVLSLETFCDRKELKRVIQDLQNRQK